jgi:RNA polymerase sigma-70 factor (ECF subfamily)
VRGWVSMTSYVGAAPMPEQGLRTLAVAVLAVGVEREDRQIRVGSGRGPGGGRMLPGRHGAAPEVPGARGEPDGRDEEVWGLVEAAQQGDTEAFGQLYDRYVDVVHRYAYARLGDRTLAEDVTSETFLRALRRIGTVSYRGRDVGAWFVTIARNLVLDHVKSGRNRYEVVSGEPLEPSGGVEGPEPAVLRRLSAEELLRCVRQLPPDQQECVVLRFLQGLSVAETAAVMSRNVGAVKALQHRALRRLAGSLPEGLR